MPKPRNAFSLRGYTLCNVEDRPNRPEYWFLGTYLYRRLRRVGRNDFPGCKGLVVAPWLVTADAVGEGLKTIQNVLSLDSCVLVKLVGAKVSLNVAQALAGVVQTSLGISQLILQALNVVRARSGSRVCHVNTLVVSLSETKEGNRPSWAG